MLGSGAMPATGPLGRSRDAVMARMFTRLFDSGLPPINAARAAMKLQPLSHTFEQHLRADRMLVLSSEAFDFPGPPLPPSVRYVGAQFDDPEWADPWVSPWPKNDARPLVLVGFSSTFQNQLAALQRVADALATLDLRGLITVGPALAIGGLKVADNISVVASAPHGQVIRHASVVVTHCGHGTAIKALSQGVPLLCIPMGRDQGDNAARAVWHGAGIRLKVSATPASIAKALNALIHESRYSDAARKLAGRIRDEGAGDRAVEELESLAIRGKRA